MKSVSNSSRPSASTRRSLALRFAPLLALLAIPIHFASANVTPSRLFASNMVLQQDTEVNLWGSAAPGETVNITASWSSNAQATAIADEAGNWKTTLTTPPAPAQQTGYTLTFSAANTVTLSNVLLGEVWLLSGQSNMDLPLVGWPNENPPAIVEGGIAAAAAANFPQIRLMIVGQRGAAEPAQVFRSHWTLASWTVCSPSSAGNFSALGYFFGRDLHQQLNVPIGLLQVSWGGSSCEAWTAPDDLERVGDYRGQGPWAPSGSGDNQTPSVLYNGMIAPIIPFTIAGALWYQGETNMGRSEQLSQLFPTMISGWREKWGQGDFPFYFAQLAPWDQYYQLQLPEFWEAQASALSLANTGLAVTLDLGDATNIHPPKKEPIGHRMALLARSRVYGQTGFEDSGPIYRSMEIEGDSIRLHFDHTGTALKAAPGGLKEFEIAGANGNYVAATATLDGKTVLVRSDAVAEPKKARYAWKRVPAVTLFNSEDLPAPSFRSEPASYVLSHYGHAYFPASIKSKGFYSQNGALFDTDQAPFIGYGINYRFEANEPDLGVLQEIARLTDSNLVRLTWPADAAGDLDSQAATLRDALMRCAAFELVPVIALEATDASTLQAAVDFWKSPQMSSLAKRFERSLILELPTGWNAGASSWKDSCQGAVAALRGVGIENLIMLDASTQNQAAALLSEANDILDADPRANLLFSLDLVDSGISASSVANILDAVKAFQIPFMINAFGGSSLEVNTAIMEASSTRSLGYAASAWRGAQADTQDALDIRSHSDPDALTTPWGEAVVNGTLGINALADRPSFLSSAFTYSRWSELQDWDTADASPEGDPDGDSISNDLERLLNRDPLARERIPSAVIRLNGHTPEFTYTMGPAAASDGVLTVQASDNLETWASYEIAFDATLDAWQWAEQSPPENLVLRDRELPDGSRELILSYSDAQDHYLKVTLQRAPMER